MDKTQWDDSLSVGIEIVDEQHKALIQRLNDVSNAVKLNQGLREIAKTLDFLAEYADFHFTAEEKYMKEAGYPGLKDQDKKHREFRDTLERLGNDFNEEGATEALAQSVNTMLIKWFIDHIKTVDMEFGAFVKEKGVAIVE